MIDDALRLTIDVLFNTKYDHTLNYKKQNVKVNKDDESSGKEMENNEKGKSSNSSKTGKDIRFIYAT